MRIPMELEKRDKIIQKIIFELMFSNPQRREHPEGVTAIEISRKFKLNIDIVKRKLKTLQEKGVAKAAGISPKFWTFDEYNFQRIDEDDPIHKIICNVENVDFDIYFDYNQ
jgi:hypothetical protein